MVDLIMYLAGSPPGCGLVSFNKKELSTNDRDSQKLTMQNGSNKNSDPRRLIHAFLDSEN